MQNSGLRDRLARFASQQAAYRALARSLRPAELAPVREQSESVLIQMQDLSARSKSHPELLGGAAFQRIDQALDEQAERTRSILAGLEMSQLRATIPTLSATHPGEVAGLVDVLITGDIEDQKSLRTLEYLITMLSAEERGGRRVLAKNPAKVTPQLRIVAQRKLKQGEAEALDAERRLEMATTDVLKETDGGETRDRMRDYKATLGSLLLHPRVLAAAVAYNVAMWNKIALEIDSSRAMEQLAEELFERSPQQLPSRPDRIGAAQDVLGSKEFELLIAAVRARVAGERSADSRANNLAAALPLDRLRAKDVEVMESDAGDESIWLMQAAIVLGGLLTRREEVISPASVLGLDLESLETDGLDDLMQRMAEHGRKCFADSQYPDAFRLAEIKTHSLAAHALARAESDPREGKTRRPVAARAESSSWLRGVSISPSILVALAVGALLALASVGGSEGKSAAEIQAMAEISPFLAMQQPPRSWPRTTHTARLNQAWDHLGTEERRSVATGIGVSFSGDETDRVVMIDAADQIAAIYSAGELVVLVPLEPEA